jgi:hypothetical protein
VDGPPRRFHAAERLTKAEVERLMIEGMQAVVLDMNVKVEAVVSLSVNWEEVDLPYCAPRWWQILLSR